MKKSYFRFLICINDNKILCILTLLLVLFIVLTSNSILSHSKFLGPDPSKVISLILIDLIIALFLVILLSRKVLRYFINLHVLQEVSVLQNRIITAFSLITAIPTIIVSVFSAYFFNFSIQSWFDKKITAVLDQSIIVAESYIDEHRLQLRETALSVAASVSDMYYDLAYNKTLFNKILNIEAAMRLLDEAILWHKPSNTIVANTSLSFGISFYYSVPEHLMQKARAGEIVEIKSDPNKLRMLIRLKDHSDVYLLVSRLIDNKVIDHIDKTNGAASEYYRLKNRISSMQIKFSIVFIIIALLLLLIAISWGIIFAANIVNPIKKLVLATKKIKAGNLSIRVPEDYNNRDEIGILSSAFNIMVQQIERQQRDLVIAQRALAWSDLARKVAHEINNPLTPIQLASERLLSKFTVQVKNQGEFYKYIQMIIRHTEDIKKIISEFVHFARLPSPVFTKCDIVSIIKNIIDSRKLIHNRILYTFNTNIKKLDFICDITQINQIMENLLKNSEESVDLNLGVINTYIENLDDKVTIRIVDNGIGFPENLINKATEAYITTRNRGSGLGLAIIKKIAQDHCAILDLENRLEGGAVVKITFDLKGLYKNLQDVKK